MPTCGNFVSPMKTGIRIFSPIWKKKKIYGENAPAQKLG